MSPLNVKDPSQNQQINELATKCKQQVESLQNNFQNIVDSLLDAYDRYLVDVIPAPSFLPVSIQVYIEEKNITIKKIILKPTDTAKDLKDMLQKKLLEMGDPILSYTSDNTFSIKEVSGPERIVTSELKPLREFHLVQGDTLILKGKVQLKSELPKQCFSITFDKSKENVMDYFTCKDCKFNWICKPCAETCHKGHQISEYISNHRPTWACCYCVKNKKCSIVNNKTK